MKLLLAGIVVHLFAVSPVYSQTPTTAPDLDGVSVTPFDHVELRGGGTVSLVPGSEYRVTLLNGAEQSMRVYTASGALYIACRQPCQDVPDGVVRVNAPTVSTLRLSGGGTMEVSEGFATASDLRVEIQDAGSINASALLAESVTVTINGGGSASVSPTRTLRARVRAGGEIVYFGEPEIQSDIKDGGAIRRAGAIPTQRRADSFHDPRDGQLYGTVRIGEQVWIDRNLAYLPHVCPAVAPNCGIWIYGYDGDNLAEAKATEEYRRYGALYDWSTAQAACPSGWHLPSDEEWQDLETALGMSPAAVAMSGWRGTNQGQALKVDGGSGLNVTLGGWRTGFGRFNFIGEHANFWCSNEVDEDHACERLVGVSRVDIGRDKGNKGVGFSVRCVQDLKAKVQPSA